MCLYNISEKHKRFAVVSGCDYLFCADFVKVRRQGYLTAGVERSCLFFQNKADFVTSSFEKVSGLRDKEELTKNYQERCKGLICKRFRSGFGCPFGVDCRYPHVRSDGKVFYLGEELEVESEYEKVLPAKEEVQHDADEVSTWCKFNYLSGSSSTHSRPCGLRNIFGA